MGKIDPETEARLNQIGSREFSFTDKELELAKSHNLDLHTQEGRKALALLTRVTPEPREQVPERVQPAPRARTLEVRGKILSGPVDSGPKNRI